MTTKIALITGANRGIGFETARQLGSRGMTVLVGARDEDRGRQAGRALREAGIDARFVQLDVTDAKSINRAAEWIKAEYGHLNILINNAGTASVARRGCPPSQTSLEDMRAVYEINVLGVVAVTNAMLPLLHRAGAARIVNVSSEVGSITSQSNPASPLSQMPAGHRRSRTQRLPRHPARRRTQRNPVGPLLDHRRRRRLRSAGLVGIARPAASSAEHQPSLRNTHAAAATAQSSTRGNHRSHSTRRRPARK